MSSFSSTNSIALVNKIQAELGGAPPVEATRDPGVPQGEMIHGTLDNSAIYPGTENNFQVYVPVQYDPAQPACLMVKMDGLDEFDSTVLDNLIAKKEVPVIIGVGITSGAIYNAPRGTPDRRAIRFNRCYQFDSMNDRFADFILNEILPAVQKLKTENGRAIRLSPDGNDHMTYGHSSGGICAFNLAWRRPDQFRRVYSSIGTFVPMRGGHEFPALIRKTESKPIRVFLTDGTEDSWNLSLGSWYDANLNVESALTFAGYDAAHAWAHYGHDGSVGARVLPDVLRWLWRDYPEPIKAGVSPNDKLMEITIPGEGWQAISQPFESTRGVIVTHDGKKYVTESGAHPDLPSKIWLITPDGKKTLVDEGLSSLSGVALSPDGGLFFAAEKTTKWIYSYVVMPDGTLAHKQPYFWLHTDDITGNGAQDLAVDTLGNLYAATPLGIQVCDHEGRVRAILPLPIPCGTPQALRFGGSQLDELYLTDGKQVFKRKMKVSGYSPANPPILPRGAG